MYESTIRNCTFELAYLLHTIIDFLQKFLDTFRCPICYGTIFPKSKVCYDCKKSIDISQLLQFENEAEKYLGRKLTEELTVLFCNYQFYR